MSFGETSQSFLKQFAVLGRGFYIYFRFLESIEMKCLCVFPIVLTFAACMSFKGPNIASGRTSCDWVWVEANPPVSPSDFAI